MLCQFEGVNENTHEGMTDKALEGRLFVYICLSVGPQAHDEMR
jgi:hypothetical protein